LGHSEVYQWRKAPDGWRASTLLRAKWRSRICARSDARPTQLAKLLLRHEIRYKGGHDQRMDGAAKRTTLTVME
jgi:hypothetical protein